MKKLLIPALVALLSASAFADDAKPAAEAAQAAPAAEAAPATEAAAPAASEEAATPAAEGEACKVVVEGNDLMKYNVQEIKINKAACPEFTVELDHVGKAPVAAMGHNIVIVKTADMAEVAKDGIAATASNDYVKPDDERVIAHTKLIGGGEKDAVTFKTDALEAGGDYEFFCSFPGHNALMKGKVVVE